MPCCYQGYLALGKEICANISFKEYSYFKYGFWPMNVDEHSFKINKPSIEEPSCSTSLRKEGKEGMKGEDSTNPSTCSSIIRLFGFSSRRISTSDDHSTLQDGGT